ncbi:MAG: 50S ribosomal protein L17 [candidate division WWE3 bacterium]|nr:50S ribosomal protein L17 [candidate division WWE3 bacterium]
MARFSSPVRQLLNSLITHNKLVTTESRAKTLKREVERLISRSKRLDLTVRRRSLALFSRKQVALKFLEQIVPQFRERVGGYVRVVKLPHRRGDRAPLARVEFVEEIKEKEVKPVKAVKTVKTVKVVRRSKARNVKNKSNKSKRS